MQGARGCWEVTHLVSGLLVSILERRKKREEMLGNVPSARTGPIGQ